jgi:hypothetical protein
MRNLHPFLLLLSMAIGCKNDPTGVWLLTLEPDPSGTECSETLTENFTYGYQPTEGTSEEWTSEESSTYAQTLAFVEILETNDQQAVLIWDTEAWPGTWNTAYWEFAWSTNADESSTQTHIAGYTYSTTSSDSTEDILNFTVDKDTATGELSTSSSQQQVWEESDIWSELLATEIGSTGSIPSSTYLVELVPKSGVETAVSNSYSSAECETEPCRIQLDTTCSQLWTFTAVRTQSELESGYAHLGGSGQ